MSYKVQQSSDKRRFQGVQRVIDRMPPGATAPQLEAELWTARGVPLPVENALGEFLVGAERVRWGRPLPESAATARIHALAQTVFDEASPDRPDARFHLNLIADARLIARALPNGEITVSTGLVGALRNKAEFIFLVAQLAGAVSLNHLSRQFAAMVGLRSPPFVVGRNSQSMLSRALASSVMGLAAGNAYAQALAHEADEYALGIMTRLGYDPSAAVELSRRLDLPEIVNWSGVRQEMLRRFINAELHGSVRADRLESVIAGRALGASERGRESFEVVQRWLPTSVGGDSLALEAVPALMEEAQDLIDRGFAERAQRKLVALLEQLEQTQGVSTSTLLHAQSLLASALAGQGRFQEARELQDLVLNGRLRESGPDAPETLQAMTKLVETLCELGLEFAPEARGFLESVIAAPEQGLSDTTPETLAARGQLAQLYLAQGRIQEGIGLQEQVAAKSREVFGDRDPRHLEASSQLAQSRVLWGAPGDEEAALKLHLQVLAELRRRFGPEDLRTQRAERALGEAWMAMGQLDEAVAIFERHFRQHHACFGPVHPDSVIARANLAIALFKRDEATEAQDLLREGIEITGSALNLSNPLPVLLGETLVMMLQATGSREKALSEGQRFLTAQEVAFTPDDLRLLESRAMVADLLAENGSLADAQQLQDTVVSGYERVNGLSSPQAQQARAALLTILQDSADHSAAVALLERMLEYRPPSDNDAVEVASLESQLAQHLTALGDFKRALHYREAIWQRLNAIEPTAHQTLWAESALAFALANVGRGADVVRHLQHIWETLAADPKADPITVLEAESNLALALMELGDAERGLFHHRQVWEACGELELDDTDHLVNRAEMNLAQALLAVGNPQESLPHSQHALIIRRQLVDDPNDEVPQLLRSNIALALRDTGHVDEALKILEEVYAFFLDRAGADSHITAMAEGHLAQTLLGVGQAPRGLKLLHHAISVHTATHGEDHPLTLELRALLPSDSDNPE